MTVPAWTDDDIRAALAAAAKGDLVDRITELGVGPTLDDASMRIGEVAAAELVERISAMLTEIGQRVVESFARGENEIDFRFDAVELGIRDAAVKLGSASLLRGVLAGIALERRRS